MTTTTHVDLDLVLTVAGELRRLCQRAVKAGVRYPVFTQESLAAALTPFVFSTPLIVPFLLTIYRWRPWMAQATACGPDLESVSTGRRPRRAFPSRL